MTDRTCSVEGCERTPKGRGWCAMHYHRWHRHGDPLHLERVRRLAPASGVCSVEGCGKPHRTRGWCVAHYTRWQRHGDPLGGVQPVTRPNGLRRCVTCKTELPLAEFYVTPSRKDGVASECKACIKANYRRWRKANPEKARANDARKRARKARVPNEVVEPVRVFARDGWICQICGQPVDRSVGFPHPASPSVDHIVPLSRGGPHVYANVQTSHLRCNLRKGRCLSGAVASDQG